MVTVFEHCEAIPFKVVIRLMVNVPGAFGTVTFSVWPVFDPAKPAPVTVQK